MSKKPRKRHGQGTVAVNVFSAVLPLDDFCVVEITTIHLNNTTLGVVGFDLERRVVKVGLDIGHPGIRAALAVKDEDTLRAYVCEQIWMMGARFREQNGNDPWDAEDWPEFLAAAESIGRKIRPRPGFDPGKIQ